MVFVMSLRLSDHKAVTQHRIFIHSSFFRFRSDFLAFFARISFFKFLEFKKFNKTIIPFALVGYETGYSQLGATGLVGYLPSHIQRALMEFKADRQQMIVVAKKYISVATVHQ